MSYFKQMLKQMQKQFNDDKIQSARSEVIQVMSIPSSQLISNSSNLKNKKNRLNPKKFKQNQIKKQQQKYKCKNQFKKQRVQQDIQIPNQRQINQATKPYELTKNNHKLLITSLLSEKVRMLREIENKKNKLQSITINRKYLNVNQDISKSKANTSRVLVTENNNKQRQQQTQNQFVEQYSSCKNKQQRKISINEVNKNEKENNQCSMVKGINQIQNIKNQLQVQMMNKIVKLLEKQAQKQRFKQKQKEKDDNLQDKQNNNCKNEFYQNKERYLYMSNLSNNNKDHINMEWNNTPKNISNRNGNNISLPHNNIQSLPNNNTQPIIINNIMRQTPIQKLDKSLIQKQIKIKLLQQQRRNRQLQILDSQIKAMSRYQNNRKNNLNNLNYYQTTRASLINNNNHNMYNSNIHNINSNIKHKRQLSQELLMMIHNNNVESNYQSVCQSNTKNQFQENTISPINQYYQNQQNPNNRISLNLNQLNKKLSQHQNQNLQDNPATSKFLSQQQSFSNHKQTNNKNNYNQQLFSLKNQQLTRQQRRKLREQKNKGNNERQQSLIKSQTIQKKQINLNNQLPKKSVLLEIPFNDHQNKQNISLADAFKKRLGGLSSQKTRQQRLRIKSMTKNQINNQNQTLNTNISNLESSISISLNIDNNGQQKAKKKLVRKAKIKQNFDVSILQTGIHINNNRINKNNKQQDKISRQPSQQLIDRLINGSRAKVSKKQMHALTKKNYEKLPEVKKKKQQEKKKLEQVQRLSRVRAYQKQLRNGSSSSVQIN